MGYRTYIASIPKREYNKIKSMTEAQLIEFYGIQYEDDGDGEYWYKGVYDYGKKLYEFGKYDGFNPPKKSMKSFFKNPVLKKKYCEGDFHVVTPEFLEYVIDTYKQRVVNYYNDMLTPFFGLEDEGIFHKRNPSEFLNTIKTEYNYPNNNYTFDFSNITQQEQNALFKILEHMSGMRTEWTYLTPYDLNKGDEVTTSWKYEYAIFELVRIYKSFDWKRNVMFYYGY